MNRGNESRCRPLSARACIAAGILTLVAGTVRPAPAQVREEEKDTVRLNAQQDERVHARSYPRPPIAGAVDRMPHEWLTAFEDIEDWQIVAQGVADPRVRRNPPRPRCRSS